ncbi:restriction endonuclease subunit S [Guyparkeria halopsychrophila]|uniref:restriction endonuclease subunit S n=1 Tax=Guyparkeria halopsychrophila TaxID=3139421 RepID=UPI0037CBF2F6
MNATSGWALAELGDIVNNFVGGGTPSKSNLQYFTGSIPFMTVKDMNVFRPSDTIDHITEQAVGGSSTKIVKAGTPVIATRMSLGKIVRTDYDVAINQDLKAVYLPEVISKDFFTYWYRSMAPAVQALGTGTTVKGVNLKQLSKIPFPIIPLVEQKQIAAKLDELLAQVDTIKARLDAIPAILKRFRQSVLAAAVSGRLTEGWRAENRSNESAKALLARLLKEREKSAPGSGRRKRRYQNPILPDVDMRPASYPPEWETVSVSQFAECLDYARVPIKKENRVSVERMYPYFGANGEVDRVDDYIFDDDLVLVTEDETFYGRKKPIAYRFTGRCWVNNHVHVLRAETKESNDFLCYSLMHYDVRPWLTGTTGRAKLTQAALKALPIGLPPLEEQAEIVRRVDQFFDFVDQIENGVRAAQTRVNQLTQSILAKAFRGELTAEWREQHPELITGENSAEALLARIREERANALRTRRGRRKASA